MADSDIVYGLGEAPRGINKRGWVYNSFCSDDPFHTETKLSLYAAHNFLMLSGSKTFGIFIDFPSKIRWDIGYTTANKTVITIDSTDFDIYYIDGTKPLEIVKEFRKSIGTSYVPPFWAFGYQQSRWSYYNAEAVDAVVDGYNKAGIPLDCVYLDIDYMERYKDFTVDDEKFPNFKDYVSKKREEGIHLIPIIDAGVKKENGYDIYEEGRKNGYFCKNEDGTDFEGGVWPGIVGFPDFLRPDVRKWFGSKYKILTDMGIDGFWNDMNEPAIFYSVKGLNKALDKAAALKGQNLDLSKFFELKDTFTGLSNSPEDYSSIYHTVDGKQVCHDQVHNISLSSTTTNCQGLLRFEAGAINAAFKISSTCSGESSCSVNLRVLLLFCISVAKLSIFFVLCTLLILRFANINIIFCTHIYVSFFFLVSIFIIEQ